MLPLDNDPALDPLDDRHFDRNQWFSAMKERSKRCSSLTTSGLAFRSLHVHGVRSALEFQRTVGNYPLALARRLKQFTTSSREDARVDILKGLDGVVRSHELLLVLGRPGSGCSTFLKAVAGDTHGICLSPDSRLNYQGIPADIMHTEFRGECVYTAENDVHFPELTVGQTLAFAASARAPRVPMAGMTRHMHAEHMKEAVITLLGLRSAVDTKLGNEFIRGVSGGERKRVSIAEALVGWSPLQCWDNSTRGLDSATALDFIRTLRTFTSTGGSAAIMTVYQGSQAMYDLFDKVTLLYEGRQIFFGRTDRAKRYFEELGFRCPEETTTADFLTGLTNPAEAGALVQDGYQDRVPRTAGEFMDCWVRSVDYAILMQDIDLFEKEFPLGGEGLARFREATRSQKDESLQRNSPYTIALSKQVQICMQRGYQRLRNEWSPPLSNIIGNTVMAIIVGSLFYNMSKDTGSFYQRGVLIFFASLLNAFMSAFEVLTMWAQRPIVEKHSRYALYHPVAEAVSSMICDLPNKILTSIFFNAALYFMTNLRRTPGAFFTFYLFSLVSLLTMSMFFRMIGSISRTVEQTMAPVGIFLANYMIYTGFVIPTGYMHPWLRWVGYIDPVSYAFESLMINEFYGVRYPCATFIPEGPTYANITTDQRVCSAVAAVPGESFVDGGAFLVESYGYYQSHMWRNLGILFAMMCFFCCIHLLAAEFIQAQKSRGDVLLFRRRDVQLIKQGDEETSSAASSVIRPKIDEASSPGSATVARLQQHTAVFHWEGVSYDVKAGRSKKRLLDRVDGWVKPGTLTALMGATGAGKTTLLDVLASRASAGIVHGKMMVNGCERDTGFQQKTGYVQQMDLHLSTATVREALSFSALLRQPATTARSEKLAYVEEIIKMLEMETYADAIVGVPGSGLNIEQRKRLTIAVEMAAKPEFLLFLDEPTSGLDSQTAWSICNLLRKLASNGQSILCTVHQPSATLFQAFDQLLLLEAPGKTVYFGPIGENSHAVINYFEKKGARPCKAGENPAEWLLEVCRSTPDIAQKWQLSEEKKSVKEHLQELAQDLKDKKLSQTYSKPSYAFAESFWVQLYEVTKRAFGEHWRTPTYFWSMFFLCTGTAFFIGFSFWMSPNTIQGLQNQVFAVFLILTMFTNIMQLIIPKFTAIRALAEARELPSKTYSWPVFILSNILLELPWQTLISVTVYLVWYFPLGNYFTAASAGPDTSERAGLTLLLIWAFMLFSSTFSHLVAAGVEHAQTAIQLAQLFYYLLLVFCGVLVNESAFPGFWTFMYRVSPLTYLVAGLISAGLGGTEVSCSSVEVREMTAPHGMSCGDYLSVYVNTAGGRVLNPGSSGQCRFCPLVHADAYLESANIEYMERWRNLGLIFAYITFNVCGTFLLYWVARVPKGRAAAARATSRTEFSEDDHSHSVERRAEK
ncbi:abc transporter cdr4 [Diplodia corticola]|uniref:Abc transporter cdr4 n=1 Tax=Diplodia corticola TaxID=236234 RepID=A0A1J9SM36_9PEZI|nr:abc transporter cdr4 [Diplodia corticola]OJD40677.1 abc transporter cdr4 [Diplodia corticola]